MDGTRTAGFEASPQRPPQTRRTSRGHPFGRVAPTGRHGKIRRPSATMPLRTVPPGRPTPGHPHLNGASPSPVAGRRRHRGSPSGPPPAPAAATPRPARPARRPAVTTTATWSSSASRSARCPTARPATPCSLAVAQRARRRGGDPAQLGDGQRLHRPARAPAAAASATASSRRAGSAAPPRASSASSSAAATVTSPAAGRRPPCGPPAPPTAAGPRGRSGPVAPAGRSRTRRGRVQPDQPGQEGARVGHPGQPVRRRRLAAGARPRARPGHATPPLRRVREQEVPLLASVIRRGRWRRQVERHQHRAGPAGQHLAVEQLVGDGEPGRPGSPRPTARSGPWAPPPRWPGRARSRPGAGSRPRAGAITTPSANESTPSARPPANISATRASSYRVRKRALLTCPYASRSDQRSAQW